MTSVLNHLSKRIDFACDVALEYQNLYGASAGRETPAAMSFSSHFLTNLFGRIQDFGCTVISLTTSIVISTDHLNCQSKVLAFGSRLLSPSADRLKGPSIAGIRAARDDGNRQNTRLQQYG